jgi:hypothetical protein
MMKKLFAIALFISLTGCSMISNIFMAPYDTNEYALVNKVRTVAELGVCDKEHVMILYITALELKNFSEYLPRNEKTIEMNNTLFGVVKDLYKRENPSQVYCKAKLNIISTSAETIQNTIGKRPR